MPRRCDDLSPGLLDVQMRRIGVIKLPESLRIDPLADTRDRVCFVLLDHISTGQEGVVATFELGLSGLTDDGDRRPSGRRWNMRSSFPATRSFLNQAIADPSHIAPLALGKDGIGGMEQIRQGRALGSGVKTTGNNFVDLLAPPPFGPGGVRGLVPE